MFGREVLGQSGASSVDGGADEVVDCFVSDCRVGLATPGAEPGGVGAWDRSPDEVSDESQFDPEDQPRVLSEPVRAVEVPQ